MHRLLKALPLVAGLTLAPIRSASAIDADTATAADDDHTTLVTASGSGSLPINSPFSDGGLKIDSVTSSPEDALPHSRSIPNQDATVTTTTQMPGKVSASLPTATSESGRSKASMMAPQGSAAKHRTPLVLSWECRSPGYGVLSLNEVSFGPECPADLMPQLNEVFSQCDDECVEVRLPPMPANAPPGTERLPYLQGNLRLVFQKLTSPERKVTYYYDNKPVHRYLILCSDRHTENDAEHAEYWLDDEPMGAWPDAAKKFAKIPWEQHAVVDVKVDFAHPMTATGNGFKGLPHDLQMLLDEHEVAVNVHMRYREPYER